MGRYAFRQLAAVHRLWTGHGPRRSLHLAGGRHL